MDSRPHSCDLKYQKPMAGSPEALNPDWLTWQDSGLAFPERDHGFPMIPPSFNSLLLNLKAFNLGKALVEILQSSCGKPDGGG